MVVKNNVKRAFAVLAAFVMMMSVFAVFCGRTSYALDALWAENNSAEEKPLVNMMGTPGSYAALADYDNCLTESEEAEILRLLHEAAEKIKCNVGLVITKDLEGMSDKSYATYFSADNFGAGSDSIVLLLLNTYNVPQYSRYQDWIYASGKEYSKFDERTTNKVFDRIYDKMGSYHGDKYAYNNNTHTYGGYDYYSACKEFAKCVKRYGATGAAAIPNFFLNYITGNFMMFFGGLVLSIAIALIVVSSKVHSYKRKATLSAANYMDRSATRVTRQVDQFVREYTTSHTHSSSSGGHHGGGGGHHGGGGGGRHR